MKTSFSPKKIQENNYSKLYGKFINNEENRLPKYRFKKFIKDIVSGTIERNEILIEELKQNCR